MKRNYIVIEGCPSNDLEIVLVNFCKLYHKGGKVEDIQFYKKNSVSDSFLILFEKELDFEHFAYLINYLNYPEGYDNWTAKIYGCYLTKFISENYEFNVGEYLTLYVSYKDKDYDNVNVVNLRNETYLYDFGGRIKKLELSERNYDLPSIDVSEYHFIKAIRFESTHNEMLETKPWWKFW
jgi:hypothetical protein